MHKDQLKYYDKKSKMFVYKPRGYFVETLTFKKFDDFSKAINYDYSDCDLSGFDFKKVEITKEMAEQCVIDSSILIERGLYDNCFYDNNVKDIDYQDTFALTEIKSHITKYEEIEEHLLDIILCYVSDIHLDHKIIKKFPNHASYKEIEKYIGEIVDSLVPDFGYRHYYLVGGDVSHNILFCKIFYEQLSRRCRKVITVLGNHELWGRGIINKTALDDYSFIKNVYRKLLDELGVVLLDDSVWYHNHYGDTGILSVDDLNKMESDEIKDKLSDSDLIIFGGTGFSGLNEQYNANNKLYRGTIDRETEIHLSSKIDSSYRKLCQIRGLEIICLTHMPVHDWSKYGYNDDWWYVNGHTHDNKCYKYGSKKTASDNQIGYYGCNFKPKYLILSGKVDIFRFLPDGIYDITREDYQKFYNFLKLDVTFRLSETLIMLKNSGFYSFFYKDEKGYHLLDGGRKTKSIGKDIELIYRKIPIQANATIDKLKPFMEYLNKISKYVKSFGGIGTIHGSIVDIDFYNHIYVNILDHSITPYYATDIVNKTVYPSIIKLLEKKRPDLANNYYLMDKEGNSLPVIYSGSKKIINYTGTEIYRPSRAIKKMQYVYNENILRKWIAEFDFIEPQDTDQIPRFNRIPAQIEMSIQKNELNVTETSVTKKAIFAIMAHEAMEVVDWCTFAKKTVEEIGDSKSLYRVKSLNNLDFLSKKLRKFYGAKAEVTIDVPMLKKAITFAKEHSAHVAIDDRELFIHELFKITNDDMKHCSEGFCEAGIEPMTTFQKYLSIYFDDGFDKLLLYDDVLKTQYHHYDKEIYDYRWNSSHTFRYVKEYLNTGEDSKFEKIANYDPMKYIKNRNNANVQYMYRMIFESVVTSLEYLSTKLEYSFKDEDNYNQAFLKLIFPDVYSGRFPLSNRTIVVDYAIVRFRDDHPADYCKSPKLIRTTIKKIVDFLC